MCLRGAQQPPQIGSHPKLLVVEKWAIDNRTINKSFVYIVVVMMRAMANKRRSACEKLNENVSKTVGLKTLFLCIFCHTFPMKTALKTVYFAVFFLIISFFNCDIFDGRHR